MSDEDIECTIIVAKDVTTVTDEQAIAVTLKGQKTIVHLDNGYEFEDVVDVTVTLKFSMRRTADTLGIEPLRAKVFALRNRDESLSDYKAELHPAMQQKIM